MGDVYERTISVVGIEGIRGNVSIFFGLDSVGWTGEKVRPGGVFGVDDGLYYVHVQLDVLLLVGINVARSIIPVYYHELLTCVNWNFRLLIKIIKFITS
jgi:hypothetical protein